MPHFAFVLKTRWMTNNLLFVFALLIGLSGCVEQSGNTGSRINLSSSTMTMELAQADKDKKKASKLIKQGKYSEAAELDEKVLAIYNKHLGSEHKKIAFCLNDLGVIYLYQGKYSKAEEAHKKVLTIIKKKLGADHPDIAYIWNNLGSVYRNQGKYSKAEEALKKALTISEKKQGADHPSIVQSWNILGLVYQNQGKYSEAEEAHKKVLTIVEKKQGADHPDIATSWNNLGSVYRSQGKYSEAEEAHKKALTIREKNSGTDHPDIAQSWNNLGLVYENQGKYSKAEEVHKKVLAIMEKTLGADHPSIATSWNNLGKVYRSQGKYSKAEEALKKALTIMEKKLGADHPSIATNWNNLGNVYVNQGKYSKAEEAHKKVLTIREKKLDADHPDIAQSWNNLGLAYENQGKYSKAEEAHKKVLAIIEKTLGADHPMIATSLNNLGLVYRHQGKYSEAEEAHKKALTIKEKKFGANHPSIAWSKANLAKSLLGITTSESIKNALDYIGQAGSTLTERSSKSLANNAGDTSEAKTYRWVHINHLDAINKAQNESIISKHGATVESFIVSQRTQTSTVATAIAKMTARMAQGTGELAQLVTRQKVVDEQLASSDKSMLEAISKGHTEVAEHHRSTITRLTEKLKKIDSKLAREYPEYIELSKPKAVSLQEAQSLLNHDEALLAIIAGGGQSYLWALRSNKAEWWALPIREKSVNKLVKKLRSAMDLTSATYSSSLPNFPIKKARELYKELIAPAEKLLKGAKRVFVVADGSMQSIPFGILVNGRNQESSYKETNWLAKKYAFSYLPSVSSLKALRTFGNTKSATGPFIGFGDPVLGGNGGELRVASIFDGRGTGLANIEGIRQLAPLPETADELHSLASTLGASSQSIYLQQNATERKLKQTNLSDSKVLAFATHGLLAGDFEFLGEPALVLTPPNKATEVDDGLLTAGEVTQLKLNADMVVLSACNTASPDGTPGAEGFSGLAKAFFYAGAKTLLVSHWPVESNSAKQLTTSMFENLRKNPDIGKAEALQQSRLQMINDKQQPYLAHPLFWAPFVVVGEAKTKH